MKHTASKLTLLAGALALTCLFATAPVRAEEKPPADATAKSDKAAEKKAKHDAEVLKKYDKNANGVLDPDELAARKANEDKMQGLRDAKKKKAAERAAAGEQGMDAKH